MSNGCVLVVDDDEGIRDSLVGILAEEGYLAVPAANGAEALDYLRCSGGPLPDLILLDLMMPQVDGWQVIAELDTEPLLADIPLVIFSASGSSAKRLSNNARVASYLRKPVTLDRLLSTVEQHRRSVQDLSCAES